MWRQTLQKDTADSHSELNHCEEDAQREEEPFEPGQNTLPRQGAEQDGVEAGTREADSGSEVVQESYITWLWRAVAGFSL